jgi:hypothetical protein
LEQAGREFAQVAVGRVEVGGPFLDALLECPLLILQALILTATRFSHGNDGCRGTEEHQGPDELRHGENTKRLDGRNESVRTPDESEQCRNDRRSDATVPGREGHSWEQQDIAGAVSHQGMQRTIHQKRGCYSS